MPDRESNPAGLRRTVRIQAGWGEERVHHIHHRIAGHIPVLATGPDPGMGLDRTPGHSPGHRHSPAEVGHSWEQGDIRVGCSHRTVHPGELHQEARRGVRREVQREVQTGEHQNH